jgi:kynurenine formamidase
MLSAEPVDITLPASPDKPMSSGTMTIVYAEGQAAHGIAPPLDIGPYLGLAVLLEFPGERLTAVELAPAIERLQSSGEKSVPPRILFRTGWTTSKSANYPYLELDAIEYLYMNGVVFIGIDTPSIDPPGQQSNAQIMQANKMPWLVNLDLSHVEVGKPYMLYAAPFHSSLKEPVPTRAFVIPLS